MAGLLNFITNLLFCLLFISQICSLIIKIRSNTLKDTLYSVHNNKNESDNNYRSLLRERFDETEV